MRAGLAYQSLGEANRTSDEVDGPEGEGTGCVRVSLRAIADSNRSSPKAEERLKGRLCQPLRSELQPSMVGEEGFIPAALPPPFRGTGCAQASAVGGPSATPCVPAWPYLRAIADSNRSSLNDEGKERGGHSPLPVQKPQPKWLGRKDSNPR